MTIIVCLPRLFTLRYKIQFFEFFQDRMVWTKIASPRALYTMNAKALLTEETGYFISVVLSSIFPTISFFD